MDPDETLRMIRHYRAEVQRMRDAADRGVRVDRHDFNVAAESLAEYVEALDEWLSKGGFVPAAWEHS